MNQQKLKNKLKYSKIEQDKVKLITQICQEYDTGNHMYDIIKILSEFNNTIYDRNKRFKVKLSIYHLLEAVTK